MCRPPEAHAIREAQGWACTPQATQRLREEPRAGDPGHGGVPTQTLALTRRDRSPTEEAPNGTALQSNYTAAEAPRSTQGVRAELCPQPLRGEGRATSTVHREGPRCPVSSGDAQFNQVDG